MIWLVVILFIVLATACFYGMHRALTDESCPGASLTDVMVALFFLAAGAAFALCAVVVAITSIVMAFI